MSTCSCMLTHAMATAFAGWILLIASPILAAAPEQTPQNDGGLIKNQHSPHAKIESVNLSDVHWTDGFWAEQFQKCRAVTLPRLWDLADSWAWHNMQVAAGEKQGEAQGCDWQDAWLYKWIESAAYLYAQNPDPELLKQMDRVIATIAKAQQPDGYLATQITLRARERFSDYHHHEVYTMGHLLTAASVHHRITGQQDLLEVACRVADFLHREYTTSTNPYLINCPVNPSVIMGAVELYRTTGEPRYLELAEIIVDNRGKPRAPVELRPNGNPRGYSDQNQDRTPLRKSTEVVGHAVFWSYLFAGAADVYMETGDESLLGALSRLWEDLTKNKMYITGGVSPVHRGLSSRAAKPGHRSITNDMVWEAAGLPYDLPSATAYNETCGQIGNLMWNWRMLSITGDARYAEVMEQSLYNAILSGVNVSGEGWSYTNPLCWYGHDHELLSNDYHTRIDPAAHQICCPTNLMRTVASWNNCLYGVSDATLWLHHYGASKAGIEVPERGKLQITQTTDYPWDGRIELKVDESTASEPVALKLRIPSWTREPAVQINGQPADVPLSPGSYATIERAWRRGDVITIELPTPVRLMAANPRVEQARGQVAVVRGPIVYCLESTDLPEGVAIDQVRLPRRPQWKAEHQRELLGGVTVLKTEAVILPALAPAGPLYQELPDAEPQRATIQLIPYFAWNNRGEPEMRVWLPVD